MNFVFISSNIENFNCTNSASDIFNILRINSFSTYAALHSYSPYDHQLIHITICNDVTCLCVVINYKSYKSPQSPKYGIKYDVSLTGLGIGINKMPDNILVTYSALDLPFTVTNESKRQNTMEFVAVIFGLLLT